MIQRKYEPHRPYRYLEYGRMSSTKQNKRSPNQQFDTIEEVRRALNYPWVKVSTYRDDGISGRYLKKRPGFQRMLRDIELGRVRVDLIVVDTLERLGRADEIAELRRKLSTDYGILVVTADTRFADPTGPMGKALGMVESVRSTEDGRVKAHNVVRGKKDAIRQKRWPGGPPPPGYRLKRVIDESVHPVKVYSVLDPIPDRLAAVRLAFDRAADTGHGCVQLARWWNDCSDIPIDLKPMTDDTLAYVLGNQIYVGTYVWGANCTDIVNDTRVIEPNPDGPHVVVPDYCDPVVDREVFDLVQRLAAARSDAVTSARANKAAGDESQKLIAPQSRGLTLKYLLTGLVRCGSCQASMRPVSSKGAGKVGKRYAYYTCPRSIAGICVNGRYVPEDRLRAAAVGRLRARLFPPADAPGRVPDWFPVLVGLVQAEQAKSHAAQPDRGAARDAELRRLADQLAGWAVTLGDLKLPPAVRADITALYESTKARQLELQTQAESDRVLSAQLRVTLDPGAVVNHLRRLDEVLAGHNPTLGNLELSRHIDRILCHPDGRVEMRGTWLGVFDGAVELLSQSPAADSAVPPTGVAGAAVTPRRRVRLRLPNLSFESMAEAPDADTALDPDRFAGLSGEFFWSEPVVVEPTKGWAESNAGAVAREEATLGSRRGLAAHFGVSTPTIRKALRLDAEQYSSEVAELRNSGMTLAELSAHFRRSERQIHAALQLADSRGCQGKSGASPEGPE